MTAMKMMFSMCILALASTVGCGGDGGYADGVATGTISGKVTFNGGAVPEGTTISFLPEGGTGIPAVGGVSADGAYKARARGTFDVPTGIYKVSVSPPQLKEMTAEEAMEASVAGNLPDQDIKEIPVKYRNVTTSGELLEVKEGENSFDLDMKP